MADESVSVRRIEWTEVLPFTRLFRAATRALHPLHLGFAFACVACCYVTGRVLDLAWADVAVDESAQRTEIHAFGANSAEAHRAWLATHRETRRQFEQQAILTLGIAADPNQARQKLAQQSAASLILTAEARTAARDALALIDRLVRQGESAIRANKDLSGDSRRDRLGDLHRAADVLRFAIARKDLARFGGPAENVRALTTLTTADPGRAPDDRQKDQKLLNDVISRAGVLAEIERKRPRGVFISLLKYEMQCFAGAVQGVAGGRWGLAGDAFSAEPSLLGSVRSAAGGAIWLVTQRPLFTLVYGLLHLALFSYFGLMIARNAAIQMTRQHGVATSACMAFAAEKFLAVYVAALAPIGMTLAIAAMLWVAGVVMAIPVLDVLGSVFLGLGLLGGFVAALAVLAMLLGMHLLTPTIAVEGSDAFDAMQRGFGYLVQRPWNVLFYSLCLLISGGVAFVMIRAIAMLTLKLTNAAVAAGTGVFGSSAMTESLTKLEAIWRMPAWSELSLLPTVSGPPFWGEFGAAPLGAFESAAWLFVSLWVFVVVGLVGAYVVSFYFCGSAEMYLLLRRDVDAVDYDEVYYEEFEAAESAAPGAPAPADNRPATAASLPVVSAGPPQST